MSMTPPITPEIRARMVLAAPATIARAEVRISDLERELHKIARLIGVSDLERDIRHVADEIARQRSSIAVARKLLQENAQC